MKRRAPNWPALLQDGGWREQKARRGYWSRYFRRHKRRVQCVYHETTESGDFWILTTNGVVNKVASLDDCLIKAESV